MVFAINSLALGQSQMHDSPSASDAAPKNMGKRTTITHLWDIRNATVWFDRNFTSKTIQYMGLGQDCSISSAMEILQSWTKS